MSFRTSFHCIYAIWPNICGPSHLDVLVKYPISKQWPLIWSWPNYSSLHSSAYAFHNILECICRNLCLLSQKNIGKVGYWCWMNRPSLQLAFKFIQKMFIRIEVRALCRPLEFLHTKLKYFHYCKWWCWLPPSQSKLKKKTPPKKVGLWKAISTTDNQYKTDIYWYILKSFVHSI